MKPVIPSSDTSALNALLATRQFYIVDLFNILLNDGTNLYYAAGDKDIIANGQTWSCGASTNGPYFQRQMSGNGSNMTATGSGSRGLISQKIGTAVDTLVFDVLPGSGTVEGFSFVQAVKLGLFDGAECIMYRAFMPTYGNVSTGIVNMFTGRVVEVDCGRSLVTFNINSHLELLTQQFPRNLFQPSCLNNFGDSACTVNKAVYTVSAKASSLSTVSAIVSTSSAINQTSSYYNLGTIKFTSGQNDGFSRNIKSFVATSSGTSTINVLVPLPYVPASSDGFTIVPGCNKTLPVCTNTYSNSSNFRGMPYIPTPETSV